MEALLGNFRHILHGIGFQTQHPNMVIRQNGHGSHRLGHGHFRLRQRHGQNSRPVLVQQQSVLAGVVRVALRHNIAMADPQSHAAHVQHALRHSKDLHFQSLLGSKIHSLHIIRNGQHAGGTKICHQVLLHTNDGLQIGQIGIVTVDLVIVVHPVDLVLHSKSIGQCLHRLPAAIRAALPVTG